MQDRFHDVRERLRDGDGDGDVEALREVRRMNGVIPVEVPRDSPCENLTRLFRCGVVGGVSSPYLLAGLSHIGELEAVMLAPRRFFLRAMGRSSLTIEAQKSAILITNSYG